ncbi:MAG: hypothetical protein U0572_01410 [Phycisphaerales bacterium]
MRCTTSVAFIVLATLTACTSPSPKPEATAPPSRAPEEMKSEDLPAPQPANVRELMRAKTAWAAALLEAVAMRNFAMVESNAEALRKLSLESAFMVQDTVTYRTYGEQFRMEVAQLAEAARRGDQGAVESGYERVTESCFRCHAYVRSEQFHSGMPGRVSMR